MHLVMHMQGGLLVLCGAWVPAGWCVLVQLCEVCSLRWVLSAEAAPAADLHVLFLSVSVLHVAWEAAQLRCGLLCALVRRCTLVYWTAPGECLCFF